MMNDEDVCPGSEIIGFDLGHGESALALATVSANTEPDPLDIQNKYSFITAVATHPTRGILIGEDAYEARELESLKVRFKSPDLSNPSVRGPIKMFVGKVLDMLLKDKLIKGGDESCFLVGCPSGWDQETRHMYRRLLHEAGLEHVMVIAESRAAFIQAKESREIPISDEKLAGSVLIVDVGSSTTDFTAVVNLKEYPVDFGHLALGAGLLDMAILERSVRVSDHRDKLKEIFRTFPAWEAKCELVCRKAKEMYFSNEERWAEEPATSSRKLPAKPPIHFDVELTQRDMAEILSKPFPELNNRSWPEVFRETLAHAKKRLQDNPPQLILLTGGASRMDFTLDLCKEVFPDTQVERGKQPELAIAKGLAWTGRIDKKTQGFIQEVEKLFTSGKIQKAVQKELPGLLTALSHALADELPERFILPAFRDWQKGRIKTLAGLEPTVETHFEKWLNSVEGKLHLAPVVAEWFSELRPEVEQLTNPICDKYQLPRTALGLPTGKAWGGKLPGGLFDPTGVIGLNDFATIVGWIVSILVATLAGGSGTAFIMAGPIGLLIGFVASAIALAIGYRAAVGWIKSLNFPVILRKLARENSIKDKLEEGKDKLETKIVESINSSPEDVKAITTEICGIVQGQLLREAEKAKLLIK